MGHYRADMYSTQKEWDDRYKPPISNKDCKWLKKSLRGQRVTGR